MITRLTREGDRDIARILADTPRLFGENQVRRYAGIINAGISMLGEDPARPSSRERSELRAGVRSFHLQFAARRRDAASHVVYYRVLIKGTGEPELVILRVLGDSMEPTRRVVTVAMRSDA